MHLAGRHIFLSLSNGWSSVQMSIVRTFLCWELSSSTYAPSLYSIASLHGGCRYDTMSIGNTIERRYSTLSFKLLEFFGAKRGHKQPYASAFSGWISCEVWVRTCQLKLLPFRGIQTFFKDFGDLCFPDLSTLNSIPHLSTGDFILDGMKFRIVFPGKRLAKPSMEITQTIIEHMKFKYPQQEPKSKIRILSEATPGLLSSFCTKKFTDFTIHVLLALDPTPTCLLEWWPLPGDKAGLVAYNPPKRRGLYLLYSHWYVLPTKGEEVMQTHLDLWHQNRSADSLNTSPIQTKLQGATSSKVNLLWCWLFLHQSRKILRPLLMLVHDFLSFPDTTAQFLLKRWTWWLEVPGRTSMI